ncbi:MAG: hypothetical protein WD749_10430 [Phycisphaerales bacterium]
MIAPGAATWKIERLATGEDGDAWENALHSFDERTAATLKAAGGTAVLRGSLLGREVVLKRWDVAGAAARLKAIVGAGRADRHWRGAQWLLDHGFATARCWVVATEQRHPCPRRWLVMECLRGPSLLELMSAGGRGTRQDHALARALGRQIAHFDALARHNRDHKPSNLIITGPDHDPAIAVIDCVGLRPGGDTARMMASLLIEPAGCGLVIRRTLAARVLRECCEALVAEEPSREERRRLERSLAASVLGRIRAHGDPRPRIDPLRPAARPYA